MSHIKAQISDLRLESLQKVLETILAYIGALYTTLLLPQLLLRYAYADQQLTAEPKALELIPVVAFVFAVLYTIYAVIGNLGRAGRIRRLQAEMASMGDCNCGHHHGADLDNHELAELESMVESALKEEDSLASAMSKSSKTKRTKTSRPSKTTKRSRK